MATTCPECGARSRDQNPRFCPSCGATLRMEEEGAPSAGLERVLFEGRPAVVGSVGALLLAVLTLGLALVFLWIRSLGKHYRITNRRIVVERGVLSKRMEQIDLYRVIDYIVERPLGQRLLRTGNLVVEATDRTTAELRIEGIRHDVRALYEALRSATEDDKRRRGVRVVDFE